MTTTVFTDNVTLVPAAWLNDADNAAYAGLTGVAGTNTITATGPANFAYAINARVWFIPAVTNSGATTINITPSGASALGDRNVFFNGAACGGGELIAGVPSMLMDDGTRFHIVGSLAVASQAVMETGTSTTAIVTPGRQPYHPASAKGWGSFTVSASPAMIANYPAAGVSCAKIGTGSYTVTHAVTVASANYAGAVSCEDATACIAQIGARGTTTLNILFWDAAGNAVDPDVGHYVIFGDLA